MEQTISALRSKGLSIAAKKDLPETFLLGLLLLIIVAAWPTYVFAGSQFAYISAAAASALLGAKLASARSQALLLLLVAEVGLLGTDANSAIGGGRPLLGTFRIIDITVASSLLALFVTIVMSRTRFSMISAEERNGSTRASDLRQPIRTHARNPGSLLIGLVLVWVISLWAAHGHPVDGITKTDLRVAGLAVATWILARTCTSGRLTDLASGIAALGPLLAAKALSIYSSNLWVVGINDRLQASMSEASGRTRVILIGGDTILILIPAIVAIALSTPRARLGRFLLWFCALASIIGLLISGTRSGLIVAPVMVAAAIALRRKRPFQKPSLRASAALAAITAFTLGGLVVTGTATRFTTPDAPHVGANFRVDEMHLFFRLRTLDILFGQGIGGRFTGKDTNGQPTVAGWSHMFPIWILLKAGALGVAAVAVGVAQVLRKGLYHRSGRQRAPDSTLGLVLFVGLLLMSLTIDRIVLPEGGLLLGLSVGLVSRRNPPQP